MTNSIATTPRCVLAPELVSGNRAFTFGRSTILFRKPFLWASPHVDQGKVLCARSLLNARQGDQTFGVVRNALLKNPSRSNPGLRSWASSQLAFPSPSLVLALDPQSIFVCAYFV